MNGSFSTATREGTTFATLGQGEITISGQTGEAIADQLAGLNRDLDTAQVITRDSSFSTGDLELDVGALLRVGENIGAIKEELERRAEVREQQRQLAEAQRIADEAQSRIEENSVTVTADLGLSGLEGLLDENSVDFDPALRSGLEAIFETPAPDQYDNLVSLLQEHDSEESRKTLAALERSIAANEQLLRDLGVIADAELLRQVAFRETNQSFQNFLETGVFARRLPTVFATPEPDGPVVPLRDVDIPRGFEVTFNEDGTVTIDGGLHSSSETMTEDAFRVWAATRGDIAPSSLEVVAAQHRNDEFQKDVAIAGGVGVAAPFVVIGGLQISTAVAAGGSNLVTLVLANPLGTNAVAWTVGDLAVGVAAPGLTVTAEAYLFGTAAAGTAGLATLYADDIIRIADDATGGVARFFSTVTGREVNAAGEAIDGGGRILIEASGGNATIRVFDEVGSSANSGGRSAPVWTWGTSNIREAEVAEAYAVIANSTTDVAAIARYLNLNERSISRLNQIKDYLFRGNNNIPGFRPDPAIATAWHRLRTGAGTASDRLLLKHEVAEIWLKKNNPGISHAEAHRRANARANWEETIPWLDFL